MGQAPAVTVAFRAENDLGRWQRSYARGSMADRMPYGLHKLARHGFDVNWLSVPEATPVQKALAIARPRGAGRHGATALGDWSIAWDEYAAVRLLAARPHARLATGVIWATDGLQRDIAARMRSRSLLRSIRNAGLVWVLSRAQVPALTAAWNGPPPRIEYLRFGIAADFFTPAALPEHPSVLSVGNDRDRDHATLLHALRAVHARRPDVRIRVQLKGDIRLPAGVERLPAVSHDVLRDVYRQSTVLAIATRPNLHVSGLTAALEAMATARPVAMTGNPGTDDYIAHGQTGLLSPPGDSEALADNILESLDPATASEFGRRGRDAVERQFTTDVMAESLAAILKG
jgi:glycosyltransferase involved in cell wall biosynthesis